VLQADSQRCWVPLRLDFCTGAHSQGGVVSQCGSAAVTVELSSCPGNCSGNGVCQNATICVCSGDFYGADSTGGLSAFVTLTNMI
jgi:hypothetical protein